MLPRDLNQFQCEGVKYLISAQLPGIPSYQSFTILVILFTLLIFRSDSFSSGDSIVL